MPDEDRMTAAAFTRKCAQKVGLGGIAVMSAAIALGAACEVASMSGEHGVLLACSVVTCAVGWALLWWLLGYRPVQRWIMTGTFRKH